MPEQFLEKWGRYIKPQWKTAFFSAIIIGFLTHLYVFTNALPNHDGLINIYSAQKKFSSGRFFLGPFSGIGSYFALPWINGTLSVLYLALTSVALTEFFELRKKLSVILTAGLLVTFPTISSTFSYMFTADGYMAGTLLTASALLLTKKYKYGFVPGALLFYLGVGIYQANLPFLLTIVTILLVSDILEKSLGAREFLVAIARFFAVTAIGMALYAITFKAYRSHSADAITGYQGLNKVGSASGSPWDTVMFAKDTAQKFFFRGFMTDFPVNLFEWLNIAVAVLIVIGAVLLAAQHRFRQKYMLLIAALLIVSLPFFAYSLYFVSSGVWYHMLMVLSLVSLYMLPVLFYDRLTLTNFGSKIFSWASVLITAVIVFNFAIIANISYFNMNLKYERSINIVNRIVDRIEQTEGYEEANQLAVYGRVVMDSQLSSVTIPENIPEMTGTTGLNFLTEPYHFTGIMENMFGLRLGPADPVSHEEIKSSALFQEMDIWPAPSSIAIVDETIIIKLNE